MKPTTPVLNSSFDNARCRHVADGITLVLHCHHFASLTTQLTNDCTLLDEKKLLAECSKDTFYDVLSSYYRRNNVSDCGVR